MQHSRLFPLLPIALALSLALGAHANDLSIAPADASSAPVADGPHLGPTEFDGSFGDLDMAQFDLWERIRKGFAIPDLNNPLVATHVTWYSSRPEYIQRTTQRASRYLFHVVQELEKRDMPMELALLPFIESAFNPQAYSSAKAAGMWQFIPSTGRDYNLKQNIFRDERRDVVASTDAALTYLQRLYAMFGDWQLALAAYNWGEGSVSRAIAKAQAAGRDTDFNSLSAYMPAETRNYYPKLQAMKNLIAAPGQYGIKLPTLENQPYFVSINKTRDIDVKLAAQLAELPMEEFKALNPQFNKPVITGSANTRILLPQLNAEKFKENLSNWTRALSSWTAHKVTAARERIETIAAKFKTTPQVIREANAIPPNMHPTAGSVLLVPKPTGSDKDIGQEIADNATLAVEPDEPSRKKIMVKAGKRDSVASIAQRYKVSVADVRDWNDLKGDKLKPGQQLKLLVKAGKAGRGKQELQIEASAKGDKSPKDARHMKSGTAEKPEKPGRHSRAEKAAKAEPAEKRGHVAKPARAERETKKVEPHHRKRRD